MRRVSKKEFFDKIGGLNVHPQLQPGEYPYTSIWKGLNYNDQNKIFGKIVESFKNGNCGAITKEYFLT